MRMLALTCLVIQPWTVGNIAHATDWRFEVTYPESLRAEPFTGRVYLFFSRTRAEPRTGPGWFGPDPFVAKEVRDWRPGTPLEIRADDETLLAFPEPLAEMSLDGWSVQPVARFSSWSRNVGTGEGNGYGPVEKLAAPFEAVTARLEITKLVEPRPFEETASRKLLQVRSKSLSAFHDRDVTINAAVHLPDEYAEHPERRYPTIFYVPGFGGTHSQSPYLRAEGETSQPFIAVMLDPSCPLGHHVFADSANNGPWGTALVEEFLPAFDSRFRTIPEPSARFLTGHSSGGWATLWMQITHPETFGGTWSTAPDPVDFRDFQRIDLTEPGANVYRDDEGERRPLARSNGEVRAWYDEFDRVETVLGPGGQLHSFEAVFGPRGENGRPVAAWDRETGNVDADVIETWAAYDIRGKLEREWPTLGPKLAGKLHVVMGAEDTFYLEGATRLLKTSLARLGSDAVVEIVPDRDHFTLLDNALRQRIRTEMTATFRANHPNWPSGK